ncbi:8-oxo-dGTP diphosphatase [Mycoplasma nasistruthionis]|uniref:8-oxo-dGTP diphosphatase n=1 Tax=Mycoplasma nasistruthionis TaxID=353852 RepID=A0A5B7XVV1_9MOLU|nr:8-oxo-dGTP diphosphatase [Mycoplasma nasistruthionis]QCZ36690.1 8-oxo-dGTP diphosphatase [Mycoplasma nasistruthionis]
MRQFENITLTNMCMIYDDKGNVLAHDRLKRWKGIAFPGGHVELNESIVDSTIREVYEETGLKVSDLQLCGIKQWFNEETGRNVCFLYKTNKFEGQLINTPEGNNFWTTFDQLAKLELADNFGIMLEVFLKDEYSEHYNNKYLNIVDELK